MTLISAKEVIAAWLQAYNSHDLDAVVALYDVEATNTQAPWGTPIVGQRAVRSTFARTFASFPDIHGVAERLVEASDVVVLEWTFSGTMHGPFAGHSPSGRRFVLRGCEIFRVDDGRIVEQRGYWDKASMFEQLGLSG